MRYDIAKWQRLKRWLDSDEWLDDRYGVPFRQAPAGPGYLDELKTLILHPWNYTKTDYSMRALGGFETIAGIPEQVPADLVAFATEQVEKVRTWAMHLLELYFLTLLDFPIKGMADAVWLERLLVIGSTSVSMRVTSFITETRSEATSPEDAIKAFFKEFQARSTR